MKKLIIHMGAHKTASTLIQQSLWQQSDQLRAQGVDFQGKESYAMGGELMNDSPLLPERLEELSKMLAASECDTVLWSCEGFVGNFYEHYANQEQVLADLAIITKDVTVEWVLYVRRQDDFIQSLYQQMVKEGRAPNFNDYQQSIANHPFDWNLICERIAKYFPDSTHHVFPYEIIYGDSGATINALCDVMNVQLEVKADIVNPSLSPLGMQLAKLAPYMPSGKLRYIYRRLLQAGFPKHQQRGHALLNEDERVELLEAYAKSNRILFERWIKDDHWRDYYLGES